MVKILALVCLVGFSAVCHAGEIESEIARGDILRITHENTIDTVIVDDITRGSLIYRTDEEAMPKSMPWKEISKIERARNRSKGEGFADGSTRGFVYGFVIGFSLGIVLELSDDECSGSGQEICFDFKVMDMGMLLGMGCGVIGFFAASAAGTATPGDTWDVIEMPVTPVVDISSDKTVRLGIKVPF